MHYKLASCNKNTINCKSIAMTEDKPVIGEKAVKPARKSSNQLSKTAEKAGGLCKDLVYSIDYYNFLMHSSCSLALYSDSFVLRVFFLNITSIRIIRCVEAAHVL